MSTLSWLAFSDTERRRTLEAIQALDEPGVRDELGLGRIRDSLAGLLFPGTSTIQTRARYFLFVPWIYLELERMSPVSDPARRVRDREIRLLQGLVREAADSDGDSDGIIGKVAGASLVQLPSQIYWGGLGSWGIRRLAGTRGAYHRLLSRSSLRDVERDNDGEPIPGELSPCWDPGLPPAPTSLPDGPGLGLTQSEARYLLEQITLNVPGTALAELLEAPDSLEAVGYVWELEASTRSLLSDRTNEIIDHAERFSLLMHGAALLYNRMLAVAAGRPELAEEYERSIAAWAQTVAVRRPDLQSWREEIDRFWGLVREGNPRVPGPLERDFVETWIGRALGGDPAALTDDEGAQEQIAARERRLKGAQARLRNRTALEAWRGAAGSNRLGFRWPNARRLLVDIREETSRA